MPANSGQKQGVLGFYRQGLRLLRDSSIPYLVGGSYALDHIERDPKDLDLFVRPQDSSAVFQTFAAAGYETRLSFPHWLGKVYWADHFIDLIFNSGTGLCTVDDDWFEHAVEAEVLGMSVRLCPPEETIWQKAFIAERERYDGADVAHMLRACGETLAWPRLLRRFDRHWRVLMSHIVLFGYIYPAERGQIPGWVMADFMKRLRDETRSTPHSSRVCQGTVLSRSQYFIDVMQWDYEDARLRPCGPLSSEEIAHWSAEVD